MSVFFLYLPFGETMAQQNAAGWETPYKFTGKVLDADRSVSKQDAETGLYYFGVRYYDPHISLWMNVDPLAEKYPGWRWSPYHYTFDNPVKFVDVTGMEEEDDYLIRINGEIIFKKTDDKFDRFYIENTQKQKGNLVIRKYNKVAQIDKNEDGLLALPTSFNSNGISFSYHGSENENFISGKAFSGLLGALNEGDFNDISFGHWSDAKGKSPKPSRSHKNGNVGDFRPLRLDKSGSPVLTTDEQFDSDRNASVVSALKKFGWTSILSEKNPATGYNTPGTKHYSGYTDRKTGQWKSVHHNNHFHIQKYKPNIINYKPYKQ